MTPTEFAARLAQALVPNTWYRTAGALRALRRHFPRHEPEAVLHAARAAGWIEDHPLFEDDFNLAADRLPITPTAK